MTFIALMGMNEDFYALTHNNILLEFQIIVLFEMEEMKKAVKEDFTRILDNSASWTDMWTKWKST